MSIAGSDKALRALLVYHLVTVRIPRSWLLLVGIAWLAEFTPYG